jgi:hypothetical protein
MGPMTRRTLVGGFAALGIGGIMVRIAGSDGSNGPSPKSPLTRVATSTPRPRKMPTKRVSTPTPTQEEETPTPTTPDRSPPLHDVSGIGHSQKAGPNPLFLRAGEWRVTISVNSKPATSQYFGAYLRPPNGGSSDRIEIASGMLQTSGLSEVGMNIEIQGEYWVYVNTYTNVMWALHFEHLD